MVGDSASELFLATVLIVHTSWFLSQGEKNVQGDSGSPIGPLPITRADYQYTVSSPYRIIPEEKNLKCLFSIFNCSMLIVVQLAAANVISHSCNSCLLSSLGSVCLDFVSPSCLLAHPAVSWSPPTFTPLTSAGSHRHRRPPQLLCLCGQTHLVFLSQLACFAGTM